MEGFGERIQYSVFVCDLSRSELVHLKARATKEMHMGEDSVVIIELGDVDERRMTFLGRRRSLPGANEATVL